MTMNKADKPQKGDFRFQLAKPAQRALANAGLVRVEQLTRITKGDLAQLHGMGPNALEAISRFMTAKKLRFKPDDASATPGKDVDAYVAAQPASLQPMLEALRQTIKAAAPKAVEVISYQIPTYKYKGPLVHFAVQKKHCSLTVVSKTVMETFKEEFMAYNISGRTIHFSPENPLPADLVTKIVLQRIKENEAAIAAKNKLRMKTNDAKAA